MKQGSQELFSESPLKTWKFSPKNLEILPCNLDFF